MKLVNFQNRKSSTTKLKVKLKKEKKLDDPPHFHEPLTPGFWNVLFLFFLFFLGGGECLPPFSSGLSYFVSHPLMRFSYFYGECRLHGFLAKNLEDSFHASQFLGSLWILECDILSLSLSLVSFPCTQVEYFQMRKIFVGDFDLLLCTIFPHLCRRNPSVVRSFCQNSRGLLNFTRLFTFFSFPFDNGGWGTVGYLFGIIHGVWLIYLWENCREVFFFFFLVFIFQKWDVRLIDIKLSMWITADWMKSFNSIKLKN